MSSAILVDNFFRHEYGKVVAILCRRIGIQHIEIIEDAVQQALMKALESWTINGLPDNPNGWVYRAARNHLIDELRRDERQTQLLSNSIELLEIATEEDDRDNSQDELLNMLFVCCHDAIAEHSRLVLALKVLCGFSISEIAPRLFTSEANVYKRLTRARHCLQQQPDLFDPPGKKAVSNRVQSVNKILYLLFTEGYLCANKAFSIRQELCLEAIRLANIVARDKQTQSAETCALLALMYFHMARMSSRLDSAGELLLLEEQDRGLWDHEQIQMGMMWLEYSAQGEHYSRYHAEAAIAAEHCLAPSFDETRWHRVVDNYSLLEQLSPSPVHQLNRAVAIAQWQGVDAGLNVLDTMDTPIWLADSYLWQAVMADLLLRSGQQKNAEQYARSALASAPTPAIKKLLEKRLAKWGYGD